MKLSRFIIALGALITAGVILLTSLSSAVGIARGDSNLSAKKMYVGEVLPDHIAYPVLMALDRFYLEISDPVERVYKQIDYANRRLYYVQQLLNQDNEEKRSLAFSTLTKAEKYLLNAANEDLVLADHHDLRQYVIKSLIFHMQISAKLGLKFPDFQRPILDQIRSEQEILLTKLQTSSS